MMGGNWGEEYRLSNSNTHTALIPYVANFGCDHSSSPTGAYLTVPSKEKLHGGCSQEL
jgi:hypothetical protein